MGLYVTDLRWRQDTCAIVYALAVDTVAKTLERLRRGSAGREQESK
jgi:hypothetical protein